MTSHESLPPPLLPCPFCGRTPKLMERPDNAAETAFIAAVVCYCGGYASCAHKMVTSNTQAEATRAVTAEWNQRAALSSRQVQPEHPMACWSVDVHDDDDGRTWINIRNPDDDVAAAGVNTYVVGNRRTLASQVLHGFHQAFHAALTAAPTPPAKPVTAPAAMNADLMQEAKTAIELAMDNLRSHGDNCFLHDDGEYNACFCGLDSLSDYLQSTVEAIEGAISAPAAEQPAASSLQPVCRYISEVLAGDAAAGEKNIARTIMHLLPLEQAALGTHPQPAVPEDVARDAERYRWIAAHCRSTPEHWGGRWSIVVEGPPPERHDDTDAFDAAIDAAMSAEKGGV